MVGSALFALWLATGEVAIPEIRHPVTDLAGVLGPVQESIARTLVDHRDKTGVQFAVLTIDTTAGMDIADFSQEVFNKWGGGAAGRDDGALFVLAIKDRRSRLHLGYGLEPVISEGLARRMLDELKPALGVADYGGATRYLVRRFIHYTEHLRPGAALSAPRVPSSWHWLLFSALGLVGGILWGIVVQPVLRRRARAAITEFGEFERPGARRKSQFLAGDRSAQGVVVLIAALQLLVLALTLPDVTLTVLHSVVLWVWLGIGWLLVGVNVTVGIVVGFGSVAALIYGCVLARNAPSLVESMDVYRMFYHSMLGFAGGCCFLGVGALGQLGQPSGGSSFTSSSWSSTSSSFSSGSSRSSSFSGGSIWSSRGASTSWSGGGGRSGGGGASSSW